MLFELNYILHYGPHLCVALVPQSPYASLTSALVCGLEVRDGRAWELFVDTGLVHILVVSGAHLVFVERLLKHFPSRVRIAILIAYSWLTGFGAPVLRALARRICKLGVAPWGWTALQVEAAVTAMIILAYPPWLVSRSFLMSWLCALALMAPLPLSKSLNKFGPSLKCYLFLFPFCPASPLAIAWNAAVGPLIGELLFPLCVATLICPPLTVLSDQAWRALLWILTMGPKAMPSGAVWSSHWLWWLPLTTHVILLFGEWKWRRALAFLP